MNELERAMKEALQEKGQEIYDRGYNDALQTCITIRSDGACCFILSMDADFRFALGDERVKLIYEIVRNAFGQNLYKSRLAAMSGALRWTPSMRPEVLVGMDGRLL